MSLKGGVQIFLAIDIEPTTASLLGVIRPGPTGSDQAQITLRLCFDLLVIVITVTFTTTNATTTMVIGHQNNQFKKFKQQRQLHQLKMCSMSVARAGGVEVR